MKFINFLILSSSDSNSGRSFSYKKFSPALATRSLELLLDKLSQLAVENKIDSIKINLFKDYNLGGL